MLRAAQGGVHEYQEKNAHLPAEVSSKLTTYVSQKYIVKRIYVPRADTGLAPIESYECQLSIGAKLASVRGI